MKSFQEFTSGNQKSSQIVVSSKHDTVFRDGGSLGYYVKNMDECGYQLLIRDFSIGSRRRGTEGCWFARKPAPNHLQKEPIDPAMISFV